VRTNTHGKPGEGRFALHAQVDLVDQQFAVGTPRRKRDPVSGPPAGRRAREFAWFRPSPHLSSPESLANARPSELYTAIRRADMLRKEADMRYSHILSLAALAIATAALAQPPAKPDNTVAATVNGETITLADVDAVLNHTLPLTPLTTAQRRQMRIEVVSDMVDDLLVRQFLRKNGPKVDPARSTRSSRPTAKSFRRREVARGVAEGNRPDGSSGARGVDRRDATHWIREAQHDRRPTESVLAANRDHFDRVEVKVRHNRAARE